MVVSGSLKDVIAHMDPEIHMNMKTAIELGRWANGERLTPEQIEFCLQAIIAYEQQHLPEHERVGFIDKSGLKKSHCHDDEAEAVKPITWVGDPP